MAFAVYQALKILVQELEMIANKVDFCRKPLMLFLLDIIVELKVVFIIKFTHCFFILHMLLGDIFWSKNLVFHFSNILEKCNVLKMKI